MPLVHVYYREGLLHQEEVKEVSACIHHALIEHFNIPENDYFHMYSPAPPIHFFTIRIISYRMGQREPITSCMSPLHADQGEQ